MLAAALQIALACGALGLMWRLGRGATIRLAPPPSTATAGVGIWSGAAFVLLAALTAVHDSHVVVVLDSSFNAFLDGRQDASAIHFVVWLTRLGDSTALLAVTVVATGFLVVTQRSSAASGLVVGFLGVESSVWLLKFWADSPRPDLDVSVDTVLSPSYPSAHAAGALLVYGLIARLLLRRTVSRTLSYDTAFATAATVGTVAFSRVMLSVHGPSEVVAGLLLGLVWLGVAIAVVNRLDQTGGRTGQGDRQPC
jgi:undecaprenyl-diphosphatase